MKYIYYLFDMDNCLIHYPDLFKFLDYILVNTVNQYHINLPNKRERDKVWNAGIWHHNILKKWGISDIDEFWQRFNENDFLLRIELIKKGTIYLYKDVLKVLSLLKENKKKTAIISNSPKNVVLEFVREFEIIHLVDEILGIDYRLESEKAKPSPIGILSILEKFNYKPTDSNAIMIGDSIVDIIAAKRANVTACLIRRDLNKYKNGFKDWEYKPDVIIENLYNLLDF